MGDIDWQKIYQATSTCDKPTPGYVFSEITRDVSYCSPDQIPAVANYLVDCVDGDHAHVKLKALFVIKTLAYRVPPFCRCVQERLSSIEAAASFSGPPSSLYGDEPYRLVREAADAALTALTSGEYFHERYRGMSQRIVGFGNYIPSEDTVLPDGSVDVGVTYRDVFALAFNFVGDGLRDAIDGVKDVLVGPADQTAKLDGLDIVDRDEAEEDAFQEGGLAFADAADGGGADADRHADEADEEDGAFEDNDVETYRPSKGEYVPPALLVPKTPAEQCWEDLWADDAAVDDADRRFTGVAATSSPPQACQDLDSVLSEAEILRVLGLSSGTGRSAFDFVDAPPEPPAATTASTESAGLEPQAPNADEDAPQAVAPGSAPALLPSAFSLGLAAKHVSCGRPAALWRRGRPPQSELFEV